MPQKHMILWGELDCTKSPDEKGLHARHNGNLFNLAYLRGKIKTNTVLICELMFTDDMAFYTHSVPMLQEMFDASLLYAACLA